MSCEEVNSSYVRNAAQGFLDAVKSDATLQENLKTSANPQAVVSIARAAGFSISVDCISSNQTRVSDDELVLLLGVRYASCLVCFQRLGDRGQYVWGYPREAVDLSLR